MDAAVSAEPRPARITLPPSLGQVVLVLQGGGALGAYQLGVYQALSEAGIEPDWVIGTSIGAINASLIAGSQPEHRIARLREFWARMERGPLQQALGTMSLFGPAAATWATIAGGIPAFFRPNPLAFTGVHTPLGRRRRGSTPLPHYARRCGSLWTSTGSTLAARD